MNTKRIGILTHALTTNYGGILQAFALQVALKRMGHEVWTIDRTVKEIPGYIKLLSLLSRIYKRTICRKSIPIRGWTNTKEKKIISQHTDRFIKANMCLTEKISTRNGFSLLNKYSFDAYIVGSDQVWRPKYVPHIADYYFEFLKKNDNVSRIAYAASFGVDYWE